MFILSKTTELVSNKGRSEVVVPRFFVRDDLKYGKGKVYEKRFFWKFFQIFLEQFIKFLQLL